MFVIGVKCNFIAKKVALKGIQRRLELSCGEIDELVDKKPKLKEWFMENHTNYRQIYKNDNSNESIDNTRTENLHVTRDKKKKALICYFTIIIVVMGIIVVVNNIVNTNTSSLNNDKYQCYIEFNNDIVDCYELSINLYLKDKGINEKIKHSSEESKVDMIAIFDTSYENLEKVRVAVNQKPVMTAKLLMERRTPTRFLF